MSRAEIWPLGRNKKAREILKRVVGNDGGFLTRRSSPIVMWVASRMNLVGEAAIAAVDDDLEEWRRYCEARAAQ